MRWWLIHVIDAFRAVQRLQLILIIIFLSPPSHTTTSYIMGLTSRALLLALILALVAIFSASSSSSSLVVDAQSQANQELLQKKITRLQAKAVKNKGIIELDTNSFEEVLAKPRNYSMAVLFTAISPEFQCVPCL